jgi:hypothetical protein
MVYPMSSPAELKESGHRVDGLGQFIIPPSDISAAWNYIKAKMTEFYALGGKLHAMQQEAATVARAARDAGDDAKYADAVDLVRRIGQLKLEHGETIGKLDDIKAKAGLGAVPLALLAIAGIVIAVAAAMAMIFRKASEQEKELDLLESGLLTPDEIEQMRRARSPGIFGGLAETAKYVALGIGMWFLLPVIVKAVKR